jgi:uncharacterized Zn finger protein (UPF0148 family)
MQYLDQFVHELKEGDVFCPQCGALKVDEAITCRRTEVRARTRSGQPVFSSAPFWMTSRNLTAASLP